MRFTFIDSDTGMLKTVLDPKLNRPGESTEGATPREDRELDETRTAPTVHFIPEPENPLPTSNT